MCLLAGWHGLSQLGVYSGTDGKGTMDIGAIYHFFFETFPGIGCLVGVVIIACLIASVIMERRTRKIFKNHQAEEDDWSFFDDDDGEDDSDNKEGK